MLPAGYRPKNKNCGNILTPKIRIQNLSGKTLTTLLVHYSVNDGPMACYNWNGSLNFLDIREITLPQLTYNPRQKGNYFVVFTSNPNGQDDNVPSNDTLVCTFYQSMTAGNPVTVEIKTDNYPKETTWKIVNSQGQEMAHGGPYPLANTVTTQTLNFNASDCYEFIVTDQYGDGFCCRHGNGYYKLKDQNNVVFAEGSSFTQQESIAFFDDITQGIQETGLLSDFQLFPNPFDNTATLSLYLAKDLNVTIIVMNEVGQIVFTLDKVILKAGNHTVDLNGESWTPGVYFVKVLAGDKLMTKKLSLTK
ncbi:MAG: T9SS type A sorting domain-containing protein [Bacteroidetes bacterium]|nr:T9SS type A sorting domain-containing protein [Bacteroidota bacterium]